MKRLSLAMAVLVAVAVATTAFAFGRRILTPEQLKKLAEFKPGFEGRGRGRRLG